MFQQRTGQLSEQAGEKRYIYIYVNLPKMVSIQDIYVHNSTERGYNPYEWPYLWVTAGATPIS